VRRFRACRVPHWLTQGDRQARLFDSGEVEKSFGEAACKNGQLHGALTSGVARPGIANS
jgi:hypothetical protein